MYVINVMHVCVIYITAYSVCVCARARTVCVFLCLMRVHISLVGALLSVCICVCINIDKAISHTSWTITKAEDRLQYEGESLQLNCPYRVSLLLPR